MDSDSGNGQDEGLGIMRVKQVKNKALVGKRRSQIMTAALDLFLEKGYHATTIRDIARRSGVNQGSLYDYVQNTASLREDFLTMYKQRTERSRSAEPLQRIKKLRLRSVYCVYGFDRISIKLGCK